MCLKWVNMPVNVLHSKNELISDLFLMLFSFPSFHLGLTWTTQVLTDLICVICKKTQYFSTNFRHFITICVIYFPETRWLEFCMRSDVCECAQNCVCMHMIHKFLMPIKLIPFYCSLDWTVQFWKRRNIQINYGIKYERQENKLWILVIVDIFFTFDIQSSNKKNVTAWCIGFNEHWTQKHCLSFTWIFVRSFAHLIFFLHFRFTCVPSTYVVCAHYLCILAHISLCIVETTHEIYVIRSVDMGSLFLLRLSVFH